MRVLKNRRVAVVIAAVVVILATLLGVYRSVGAQARRVEAYFDDGAPNARGYIEPSIASQLDKRLTAAASLCGVTSKYSELSQDTAALRSRRGELMNAPGIPEKRAANDGMQEAYETLYERFLTLDTQPRDLSLAQDYAGTLDGAQGIIDRSGYNAQVEEFDRIMNAFPVGLLRHIAFADAPEAF